jgi:hypothetical protein
MMRTTLYQAAQKHADAFAMVLAQGLGDEDRQASRHEKSDRSFGTPVVVIMHRIRWTRPRSRG